MIHSPLALLTWPTGVMTAAVPQAKTSVSSPESHSPRHWSAEILPSSVGKPRSIRTAEQGNYGSPFCTYPWYAFNKTDNAFTYGGDYPGTSNDFGQATQFQQQENCVSPAGPFPQYCSTVLK